MIKLIFHSVNTEFSYFFWKDIKGYEDNYSISILGIISKSRQQKWKITKDKYRRLVLGKVGYKVCALYKDGKEKMFLFHRLLGFHFIPIIDPNKKFINHKDGNKLNCSLTNLEWTTQAENNQHAYDTGLKGTDHLRLQARGKHPCAKKVGQFDESMNMVATHDCMLDATDALNVSVWYFIKNGRQCPKGFYWKYI